MCGICGKLLFHREGSVSPALIKGMADSISHRGPDDEGYYVSGPVGLGFRRLSIIDLSGGHQPLSNEDGSVHIIFNGEIYNYQELRRYLVGHGHIFKTQTDTETIVHLYEQLGEACVEKLRGMFAFAIGTIAINRFSSLAIGLELSLCITRNRGIRWFLLRRSKPSLPIPK